MTPGLHATLVGSAAVMAVVIAGLMLARHPASTAVRVHAIYGGTAAWWLLSMAMVAGAESVERVQLWARLAHLGIGMLPGVIYHVNVTTAGLGLERRRQIRVYYGLSVAVTVFALAWPGLLSEPRVFAWGYYPAYTLWGLVPVGLLLLAFAQALRVYREALRRFEPGSPHHRRARAFYTGNYFAYLAAADFLPAFGVGVYPFGYILITVMYVATMVGALRYRLIEITPAIAAEHILETIPEGLLVVDTQGTVRLANRAAAGLFGCADSDLLGRPMGGISADPAVARAFDPGSPAGREVRFEGPDGTRLLVVSGAPMHDPWGETLGHVWVLRDLTEQRRAEAEQQRLESWLRQTQKMESLGVMAGGIAHDFNNILMAILGSADAARRKVDRGAAIDEELRTIGTSVEHAASLTDQLLTYAGRGTSVEALVDLNTLARDMADLLRSAISKKATLRMQLAPDLPLIVGDESQMRQVILNLVTNASEALGEGAGTVTLVTGVVEPGEASSQEWQVTLEVTDTGAGMDADTRTRVFDPFFTTKFEGRGLGLATVLSIVQRHGGIISLESEPGRGTRFEVALPARGRTQPPMATARPEMGLWKACGSALLVDDEAAVRMVVREMLCELGFEVVEAEDGAAAVEIFESRPRDFCLAVLDMTMPRMSGTETLAALRSRVPTLPVVVISGYAAVEGADPVADPRTAFLHKPFKLPALATRIREVMAADLPRDHS